MINLCQICYFKTRAGRRISFSSAKWHGQIVLKG